MKKSVKIIIYGIPVFLFLLASVYDFAKSNNGIVINGTSIIDNEVLYGTLYSIIYIFILSTFIGITLIASNNTMSQSIGKALYSAAMVTITILYIWMKDAIRFDDNAYKLAFGGQVFALAIVVGLGLALSFLILPIIEELRINKALNESLENEESEDVI